MARNPTLTRGRVKVINNGLHGFDGLAYMFNVRGKAPEVRKNTDGGANPRYRSINKTKAPRGRQRPKHVVIKQVYIFCRPFRASFAVALLPGVYTPVCGLSSLRDLSYAPMSCFSLRKPNNRRISRGAWDFPWTTIILDADYQFTFNPFNPFNPLFYYIHCLQVPQVLLAMSIKGAGRRTWKMPFHGGFPV